MGIRYNFISLVALGNFNPAIVSPTFLKEECGLELGKIIEESPIAIPVHKVIQFPDIRIMVELHRFELRKTNIQTEKCSNLIDIFKIYYEKLPYTPLNAVGVNINCDFFKEEKNDFENLLHKISNHETYLSFFSVDSISASEKLIYTKETKFWKGTNFVFDKSKNLRHQISVSRKKDSFAINYNYEVTNWSRDDNSLRNFVEYYEPFCNEFVDFEKHLRS